MNTKRISAVALFLLVMAFPFRWAYFLETSETNVSSLFSFLMVLLGFAIIGVLFESAATEKNH